MHIDKLVKGPGPEILRPPDRGVHTDHAVELFCLRVKGPILLMPEGLPQADCRQHHPHQPELLYGPAQFLDRF